MLIVDGRVVVETLPHTDVDPEDIVSVEVIKGTRAVEQYGGDATAYRGVIIVTTRGQNTR